MTCRISPTVLIPWTSSSVRTIPKSLSRLAIRVSTPKESQAAIASRGVSDVNLSGDVSKILAIHSIASRCVILTPALLSGTSPVHDQFGPGDPFAFRRQEEGRRMSDVLSGSETKGMRVFERLHLLPG